MRILINMDHCRFVEIPRPGNDLRQTRKTGRHWRSGFVPVCFSVRYPVHPQGRCVCRKDAAASGVFQTGGDPVCLQIYFLILCYRGCIICGRCGIFPLPLSAARRSQVPDHPSVPDETVRPGPFFPLTFPWLRYCRQRLWL